MSTSPLPIETTARRDNPREEENWLELVKRQVGTLKFGAVHITVHEGRVVQVETSVRVRFDKGQ